MLSVAIKDVLDVLEGSSGERAHVKPESQEVSVKERGHQRVSEQQRAKEHPGKDGDLDISNEAHGGIVVGLDPTLDKLGDLGRGCGRLGGRSASGSGLVSTGCGRGRGESDGNDGGAEEGEDMEERKSDKGNKGDKDGLGHEPVDGEEEVLDVFIHQRTLDVGLVELGDAKGLVDDDTVRDDGAEIGGRVPSRETARSGCKHQRAGEITKPGSETQEVARSPDEVWRGRGWTWLCRPERMVQTEAELVR